MTARFNGALPQHVRLLAAGLALAGAPGCALSTVAHPVDASGWQARVAPPRVTCESEMRLAYGVDLTRRVLESAEFREKLVAVDALSRGLWRGTTTGLEFAQQFLLESSDYRVGPTVVRIDPAQSGNAGTVWNIAAGAMEIVFNDNIRPRLRSPSLAALACAVDTIAHEEVHTLWRTGDPSHAEVYTDWGHRFAWSPLASYTVGAIAHCTVFRLYGSLRDDGEFWRCVRAVGTTTFAAGTCEESGDFAQWARPCGAGTAGCQVLPPRP